ncbi:hypothetical protein CVT25_000066 [Psilocybe cyanescens]|uniref:Uncharacterized protein n=1 Tax=Psilocybe cyanescens TaxID=93625 RepID=A0A409XEM3_PSICY|nr:hypothetical protein CVT25_000066 [Psilocybe cyanescens]
MPAEKFFVCFSLPCQHSLSHYKHLIQEFGSPSGVCSSITESHHITVVKKPWRQLNQYNALSQMPLINQQEEKLAAAQVDFVECGMLPPSILPKKRPKKLPAKEAPGVDLERVEGNFLFQQLNPDLNPDNFSFEDFPCITEKVSIFHSAVATFYAPSDECGIYGMHHEWIQCASQWCKKAPCRDCVFVVEDEDIPGMRGINMACIALFFSFSHEAKTYPCALVKWFSTIGQSWDPTTGMWRVWLDLQNGCRLLGVIHLNTILWGAHLLPVFG